MHLNLVKAVEAGFTLGQANALPRTLVAHKPHRFIRDAYRDSHRRHDLLGYILNGFGINVDFTDFNDCARKFKTDPVASLVAKTMHSIIAADFPESMPKPEKSYSISSDISYFNDNNLKKHTRSDIAMVWKKTLEALGYEAESLAESVEAA